MAKIIFVIDDSNEIRILLKMFLEGEGFAVATAYDGLDAFEQLKTGLSPSLILIDMLMDRMSGAEFLEKLKTELPEVFNTTPIVATSALRSSPTHDVDAFIPKPIDLTFLLQTLQVQLTSGPAEHQERPRV